MAGGGFPNFIRMTRKLDGMVDEQPFKMRGTWWAFALVISFSVGYHLLYHFLPNLHDTTHYIVAGISMVQDGHSLMYPYGSMDPAPGWSAYKYFQDNGRLVSLYKAYPSQLYSMLFGLYYAATGSISYGLVQLLPLLTFTTGNVFLFLIGCRLWGRAAGLLFVVAVACTPLTHTILYPGNDGFSYLSCIVVIWACLCTKQRPLLIGVLIGVSGHLRSQALELAVVAPLLFMVKRGEQKLSVTLLRYVVGLALAYLILGKLFQIWVGQAQTSDDGGLGYYFQYFRAILPTVNGLPIVVNRLAHNIIALLNSQSLYLLVVTGIACAFFPAPKYTRTLTVGALFIIAVPLVLYSIDPFSDPHPRYYIMAVPLLVFAWFYWMLSTDSIRGSGGLGAVLFTTILSVGASVHWYGVPWENVSSWAAVRDRFTYPDATAFKKALSGKFSPDDLVITNHALASVLTPVKDFIPYPPYSEFVSGDNRDVDGLIFVFGNYPPDDFFYPRDWLKNGQLPALIRDNNGTEFQLVACRVEAVPDRPPGSKNAIEFVAYKNTKPAVHQHVGSTRVYQIQSPIGQLSIRTKDPTFESADAWKGTPQRVHLQSGVVVGPGTNNANILSQAFSVSPGERVLIKVVASAYGMPRAKGRLQINWLDENQVFIKTDIATFDATEASRQYARDATAPPGAHEGIIIITPHTDRDILRFDSAEILGAPEKSR